jgi:hypothetical protein
MGNRSSPRISEADAPVGKLRDRVAALVYEAVVTATQEDEVVDPRLTATRPVPDVVGIEETPVLAARETAAAITRLQGSSQRRRDRARLPADGERLALALPDLDERGIAGKAPGGLGSERRLFLERAGLGPAMQRRFLDVDDQLVALTAGSAMALARKCKFGHRCQRFGVARPPHAFPRFRGTALCRPFALLKPIAGRAKRLQDKRTVLGRETRSNDQ